MSKLESIYPECSSFESFVKEYDKNHNEYTFKYKNFCIRLNYNRDGSKFVIYRAKEEYYEKSIFWRMFHHNKIEMLDYQEFDTPIELAQNAIIDGKTLIEIWDELE